jgi:methylmalonyl-CoA/ethylmalonyl-CoA epimerase
LFFVACALFEFLFLRHQNWTERGSNHIDIRNYFFALPLIALRDLPDVVLELLLTRPLGANKRTSMSESAVMTFGGLFQIGQIAVPVSDVELSIRFYRDTLGMRFLFQAPPGLGFFDLNGVRLMLDGPAKAQAGNSSVIYYKVTDLQVAFTTLSQRGIQFEAKPHLIAKMPDHELWMAFFRDPDKNLLALMSEVRG